MDDLTRAVYARLLQDDDGAIVEDSEEALAYMQAHALPVQAQVAQPRTVTVRTDEPKARTPAGSPSCQKVPPTNPPPLPERFLTVADIARLFNKHPGSVYRWIKTGALQAFQPIAGGPWHIPSSAVTAFLVGRGAKGEGDA